MAGGNILSSQDMKTLELGAPGEGSGPVRAPSPRLAAAIAGKGEAPVARLLTSTDVGDHEASCASSVPVRGIAAMRLGAVGEGASPSVARPADERLLGESGLAPAEQHAARARGILGLPLSNVPRTGGMDSSAGVGTMGGTAGSVGAGAVGAGLLGAMRRTLSACGPRAEPQRRGGLSLPRCESAATDSEQLRESEPRVRSVQPVPSPRSRLGLNASLSLSRQSSGGDQENVGLPASPKLDMSGTQPPRATSPNTTRLLGRIVSQTFSPVSDGAATPPLRPKPGEGSVVSPNSARRVSDAGASRASLEVVGPEPGQRRMSDPQSHTVYYGTGERLYEHDGKGSYVPADTTAEKKTDVQAPEEAVEEPSLPSAYASSIFSPESDSEREEMFFCDVDGISMMPFTKYDAGWLRNMRNASWQDIVASCTAQGRLPASISCMRRVRGAEKVPVVQGTGPRAGVGMEPYVAVTRPQQDLCTVGRYTFFSSFDSGNLAKAAWSAGHDGQRKMAVDSVDLWTRRDSEDFGIDNSYSSWFYFAVIGGVKGKILHMHMRTLSAHANLFKRGHYPVIRRHVPGRTTPPQWEHLVTPLQEPLPLRDVGSGKGGTSSRKGTGECKGKGALCMEYKFRESGEVVEFALTYPHSTGYLYRTLDRLTLLFCQTHRPTEYQLACAMNSEEKPGSGAPGGWWPLLVKEPPKAQKVEAPKKATGRRRNRAGAQTTTRQAAKSSPAEATTASDTVEKPVNFTPETAQRCRATWPPPPPQVGDVGARIGDEDGPWDAWENDRAPKPDLIGGDASMGSLEDFEPEPGSLSHRWRKKVADAGVDVLGPKKRREAAKSQENGAIRARTRISRALATDIYFHVDVLATSLEGLPCPLITVSSSEGLCSWLVEDMNASYVDGKPPKQWKAKREDTVWTLFPYTYSRPESFTDVVEEVKIPWSDDCIEKHKTFGGIKGGEREASVDLYKFFQNHRKLSHLVIGARRAYRFADSKPIVFVSARVHPGETPGSHILDGFLYFILSQDPRARLLRHLFVFKIVPCLNPDGVSLGHYRVDTRGANLNRVYEKASEIVGDAYPTTTAVSKLLDYFAAKSRVAVYIDLHAHASRTGCFAFGNHFAEEAVLVESALLPFLIAQNSPSFDFDQCDFGKKNMVAADKRDDATKLGTGRVMALLKFNLLHAFTIEANYARGMRVNTLTPLPILSAKEPP